MVENPDENPAAESRPGRASLTKGQSEVAAMFDRVARRYDLANDVLSLGQDRAWRSAVIEASRPRRGDRVLDVAAGTGTSSEPFVRAGCFVAPTDISLGMLAVGKQRRPSLSFVAGDALSLPFAEASFDVVTMSFGLRNVPDPQAACCELLRVTRPGGQLVICEFSTPSWPPLRWVYDTCVLPALPRVARLVSSNPVAYEYLAESIQAWPDQQGLSEVIGAAGWREVEWRNLSGGIVALHRARAGTRT
jgi:demethylmenaquinone methyltransferase / 2-methoxy-6-polyprenyl-1,4-benzoquinol methylase